MSYEGQFESSASDRELIPKLWGSEELLVNEAYCGKILRLRPGFQSSLHYHEYKDETYFCVNGLVIVEVGRRITVLRGASKDVLRIPPRTPHRFRAVDGPATIIEFSTHHDDNDVVRLEPSCECRQI